MSVGRDVKRKEGGVSAFPPKNFSMKRVYLRKKKIVNGSTSQNSRRKSSWKGRADQIAQGMSGTLIIPNFLGKEASSRCRNRRKINGTILREKKKPREVININRRTLIVPKRE